MTEVVLFTPREYQLEAGEHVYNAPTRGRAIIGDEMGLGKTGEGYLAWKRLGCPTPCLIIAGRNAQLGWRKFAPNWGVPTPIPVRGNPAKRADLWQQVILGKYPVTMTTREGLKIDLKRGVIGTQWAFIIVDEAHKDMNRKKTNYALLKKLAADSKCMVLITGNPIKRGPQRLWALLNVLYPKKYSSFWAFVNKWCYTQMGPFGLEILGPKNPDALAQELAPILIRRTKKQVAPQLPAKTRILDHVLDLTPQQEGVYESLVEASLADMPSGGLVVASTVLARITKLRQLLCCPKILDPELDDGAALDHLVDMFGEIEDHHMVVFTPFKAAFPHVKARLVKEGVAESSIVQLQGGMDIDNLDRELTRFRDTRGIAMCTIPFAEAFDLVPATWAYFLGYEWDRDMNLQAEDRLHRMTTTEKTFYYYPQHRGCIDQELMLESLNNQSTNVSAVYNSIDKVRQALTAFKQREKGGGE